MDDLPTPLTPADCDLRAFPYMPLDVARLRDSGIAAVGDAEAFRAAVLSWCVSWHQVPAASLPDDDAELCRLLGYGRDFDEWKRVRAAGALRGWVKCSDARLYHPVVAKKANEAWEKRRKRSQAGVEGNRVRWGQSADPTTDKIMSGSHCDRNAIQMRSQAGRNREERKGEKKKEEQKHSLRSTAARVRDVNDLAFAAFWAAYPRKADKGHARTAWAAALRKADAAVIMAGLARHRFSEDPKYRPLAATWLNGERWDDAGGGQQEPSLPSWIDPNASRPSVANPLGRPVTRITGGL